jgi:protein-tyrosine phosphatase
MVAQIWDIHAHILPDTDDGPESIDSALATMKIAVDCGVTGIVATPHSESIAEANGPSAVEDSLSELKALVREQGLAIELVSGMEVHLLLDTAERLFAGDCISLDGTRFALIEFDYFQWANYPADVMFEIAVAEFTSVLVHIERIAPLAEYPDRFQAFVG